MTSVRLRCLLFITASLAMAQQPQSPANGVFEEQKMLVLSNRNIELTVLEQGATIANLTLKDDPDKLSPLWNPLRLARDEGRRGQFGSGFGHFVCVDGFGQPSADERAAGLPGHGEAHLIHLAVTKDTATNSVSMIGKLPSVEEMFTRTFHVVEGESVVYVDSTLENLLGFDRPVNWAEHATVSAPFLESGKSTIALSGNWQPATQRRLAPGKDFTWPMAPGLDSTVNPSTCTSSRKITLVQDKSELSKKQALL